MAEATPSAPPLPSLAPLGELVQGLLKIPQQIVQETQPGLQQQLKELPETLQINARHFVQQLQEIPAAFTKQANDLTKSGFPVTTTAKAVSVLPMLSSEEIQKVKEATIKAQQ